VPIKKSPWSETSLKDIKVNCHVMSCMYVQYILRAHVSQWRRQAMECTLLATMYFMYTSTGDASYFFKPCASQKGSKLLAKNFAFDSFGAMLEQ